MMYYRTPRIAFHGGKCCGVKTIYNFNNSPDAKADELQKTTPDNSDQCGHHVSSETNFFADAAPKETYLQRLDRYLTYLKAVRPYGIIEVILIHDPGCEEQDTCPCGDHQVRDWGPLLEERGFKAVSTCFNSNSSNRITVYHLCMDKE